MQDPADANNAQPQVVQFDPSTVKPGEAYKLPEEQRKIWFKWHQDQEAQKAQQHKSQTPARSAPSGGGGGPAGGAAGDAGPSSRFGARIILVGDHGDMGGSRPRINAADGPAPARTFAQPQAVTIYRYKLRVYLKNPLFGTVNVAKNPVNAKVFSIPMETADWSKPIVSPKKHEFFVINGGTTFNGVAKVGIDYLDWQD